MTGANLHDSILALSMQLLQQRMYSFLPVVSVKTGNSLVELNESLHGMTELFFYEELLKYPRKVNGLSIRYLNEGIEKNEK